MRLLRVLDASKGQGAQLALTERASVNDLLVSGKLPCEGCSHMCVQRILGRPRPAPAANQYMFVASTEPDKVGWHRA